MESTVTILSTFDFVTTNCSQNNDENVTSSSSNISISLERVNATNDIYGNPGTYPSPLLAVIFTLVSLFLGITGILCGSLVLFVMLVTKSTRTLGSAFLINLVCSDLLLCATVFPAVILDMKKTLTGEEKRVPDGVPCQLLGFLLGVFSYNSVLSLSVIALDRYQAIVNCLEYTTYTTYKRVSRGLAFCWIQSIGWSIAPILGWGSVAYKDSRFMCVSVPNYSSSYTAVLFLTQFIAVVIIMSVCYVKIIKIARRHARRICDINSQLQNRGQTSHRMSNIPQIDPGGILAFALVDPVKRLSLFPEFVGNGLGVQQGAVAGQNVDVDYHSSGSNTSNTGMNLHKEARATIKLLGLVLVFIFTWIQIHIVNLLSLFSEVNKTWESFAFLLACSNSCCNPVMYILASRRFRHNLKKRMNYCFKFRKSTKKATHSSDKRNKIARQMASLYTNSKPNGVANTSRDGHTSNFDASVIIHPVPSDSSSNSPKLFILDGSAKCLSQESLSKVEPSTTAGGDISPMVTRKKRKKKKITKRPKYLKREVNNYVFNDAHTKQSNSNISLQKTSPLPPIGVKL